MPKLENAEATLALLKTLLRDTALWTDLTVNHSEELGPGVPLCDVVLKSEKPKESWNWFLNKFWVRSKQDRHPSPSPYFVSRCEAPAWLSLTTYDRLAFSEFVPQFAKALEGERVELLVESHGWTWDHDTPRKNGRPTHKTSFRLIVQLHAAADFKSAPWLKKALANVCASTDPRADEYIFDYEEDQLGRKHCCSMESTRKGLILGFSDRAHAEKVVGALFSDCSPKFGKNPDNGNVEVTLTLPG